MAQAVAAIVLQQPDNARARPTTVADKNYVSLFSEKYPLEMYQKCAQVMKRVDSFLEEADLERGEKLNLMFYVAMFAVSAALKSVKPKRSTIANMDVDMLSDQLLKDCYTKVFSRYKNFGGGDKVAKGTSLTTALKADLVSEYGGQRKNTKTKPSRRS